MESSEGKVTETSDSEDTYTKLRRIAELARKAPQMVLTTLAHHIDLNWMHEAHRRTRKNGATGVDEQTAESYAENLEENLADLLERFKSGRYRAPPVRRVHIPKADGSTKRRPIGIPTFGDKVLQRAVAMALEAVYEQDFLDCSYGFRPGRGAHDAVQALWEGLMKMGGGHVVDLDISSFFDTIDRGHLRSFLDQRVRDGVLRRAIDKWLKAGVLEEGELYRPDKGTPQGGVVSPLLANIYLHEVLDKWFETVVKPRMRGWAMLIRYADDAVMVFSSEQDAQRVMKVLPKRFGKYGLKLHPEKTRMVPFERPGPRTQKQSGRERPGTFDLLGFTHYWGKSRKGKWVVKRKTAKKRFSRALKSVKHWGKRNRHLRLTQQHQALISKLKGHYGYYGITGNYTPLSSFRREVLRIWRKWLGRRSQRAYLNWDRVNELMRIFPLPEPRVVHSVYATAAKP
jgi:RNA-directed DNA polymerase